MHVEIITIGDELLLGFTVDTNAAYIARQLLPLGIAVSRRATVGDDAHAIIDAVNGALARADGAITTGGLGPTSDDVTREAIARAFARRMVFHEAVLEDIRRKWSSRNATPMPEANRAQAMVPERAEVIPNAHGTAPGIWIENDAGKWLAMLPGVPREMRAMIADAVVPRLRARTADRGEVIGWRVIRTIGVPESRIAEMIEGVERPPGVELAFLPGWEGVDLRLTVRGMSQADADSALERAVSPLRVALGNAVYGTETDDLAAVVLGALRERGWTLAVAESCTGGLLGARLTAIPNASDVFLGGVIAYDNRVKQSHLDVSPATLASHGAVSEAVAREMATGACSALGAEVGVAITGVAGPSGGTSEKPVGTVCLAVALPGQARSVEVRFPGDRAEIRERSAQAALNLVRKALVERAGTASESTT